MGALMTLMRRPVDFKPRPVEGSPAAFSEPPYQISCLMVGNG